MTTQYRPHPTLPDLWLDSQGRAVRADRSLACPNGCETPLEGPGASASSEFGPYCCPACSWFGVPPVYVPEPTPYRINNEALGMLVDGPPIPLADITRRRSPAPRATNAPEPVGTLDRLADHWAAIYMAIDGDEDGLDEPALEAIGRRLGLDDDAMDAALDRYDGKRPPEPTLSPDRSLDSYEDALDYGTP